MDGRVEAGRGVVDGPAAVGASPGGAIRAEREHDAVRAGFEGDLATPVVGSFHSAITREASRSCGRERSTMPNEVRVSTAEPGSSARTLA